MMLVLMLTAQSLPIQDLRSHWSGGGPDAREAVIRDRVAYEALWKQLAPALKELPPVDFDRESLIFVAMGRRSSGGYTVTVESAELKDGEAVVKVLRRSPRDGKGIAVLTTPYTLVKTARLPEKVRFLDVAPKD